VETLSAEQVKEIIDASLKNLEIITASDVADVVNEAVDGAVETLKANVGTTGITKEDMNAAM
jgi:GH35 family endo-1,4-beta-xylanase